MNDAKGKFIASDGNVISFEKMSKKLSELSGTSQYFKLSPLSRHFV